MRQGFAMFIALVIFVMATVLSFILITVASRAGSDVRAEQDGQAARRAAENMLRIAQERIAQKATQSYYTDPAEAFYWFGGDLPDGAGSFGDGFISFENGELPGLDYGPDGLPNVLEPGFYAGGPLVPLGPAVAAVLDPIGDDFSTLVEGNNQYGAPTTTTGRTNLLQFSFAPPGLVPLPLTQADALPGADGFASYQEINALTGAVYQEFINPDPSGDDYHPILNPMGDEGRVVDQFGAFVLIGNTVETTQSRWRRKIIPLGPMGEYGNDNLSGYGAVRAVDTSTKIDLNGPSLLTARLINSLINTTGVYEGSITASDTANVIVGSPANLRIPGLGGTDGNPPIGKNGRGIEAISSLPGFAGGGPIGVASRDMLNEFPQWLLLSSPAFFPIGADIISLPVPPCGTPPCPPTQPPRKIATSKAEEENYFQQPVNALDPDTVAIIKYRNQVLGGRFASVNELFAVTRADGTLLFGPGDRDEFIRLSQFLTIETWRDSQTISRRNGEPLMNYNSPKMVFEWDYIPSGGVAGDVSATEYVEPEPWQDVIANFIYDGGERFDDFGMDVDISGGTNYSQTSLFPDRLVAGVPLYTDPTYGPKAIEPGWDPFLNPDPGLDDESQWNPFFIGKQNVQTKGGAGEKTISIRSHRNGPFAWSPFLTSGIINNPLLHNRIPKKTGPTGISRPLYENFNYFATEGNGALDLDPWRKESSVYMSTAQLPKVTEPGSPLDAKVMLFERWWFDQYDYVSGPFPFDTGVDQLSGTSLQEFFLNFSVTVLASDPSQDDFNAAAVPLGIQICTGLGASCPGATNDVAFGMRRDFGTEGNFRYDPYPELVRMDIGLPADTTRGDNNNFDMPSTWTFSPSPLANLILPKPYLPRKDFDNNSSTFDEELLAPKWALPDQDWYHEPGESYRDNGRDRIPFTGDFGERNGQWDPGETFSDLGNDNLQSNSEYAFCESGLITVLQSCKDRGATDATDLHSEDSYFLRSVSVGTEENQRMNFLREPYLDLNRNKIWDRGSTIQRTYTPGVGWNTPTATPGDLGSFQDSDGNRRYDDGVYKESRAPININGAPEEVIAAVILTGLVTPTKQNWDRFTSVNLDFWNAAAQSSDYDDFDWSSMACFNLFGGAPFAYDPTPGAASWVYTPDTYFAECLARGFARAVFLKRLGQITGYPGGPFLDWQDFENFTRFVIGGPTNIGLTGNFPNYLGNAATTSTGQLIVDPFGLQSATRYLPGGAGMLREIMADRIIVQANPNSRLQDISNYPYINPTRFDKTDFPFPTTEFCFGATGIFEITAIGYAVSDQPNLSNGILPQAQILGAGFAGPNSQLLSSGRVRATTEITRTVKVFEHHRLSTAADFKNTAQANRNVEIFPKNHKPDDFSLGSSIAINEEQSPSDAGEIGGVYTYDTSTRPYLFVKPRLLEVDDVTGLLFAASTSPYDMAVTVDPILVPGHGVTGYSPSGVNHDPGGIIQVFRILPGAIQDVKGSLRNFPRNNTIYRNFNITDSLGPNYNNRLGLIEPGNGINGTGPTIAAMAFDGNFPRPITFPPLPARYFGRLYFLDNQTQSLRAIDCGEDETGGLLTTEVTFAGDISYPAGSSIGLAIEVVPSRREIYVLTRNSAFNPANLFSIYRYAEGQSFPPTNPTTGASMLTRMAGPVNLGVQAANQGNFAEIVADPLTGFVYIGVQFRFGVGAGAARDFRIYRYNGNPGQNLDIVFPNIPGVNPGFTVPGYNALASIVNLPPNATRELVSMELDPGTGVLFVLWNRTDIIGGGGELNGPGAYLAAVPIGSAEYLSAPLVNPFPMYLPQTVTPKPTPNFNDTNTVYAAGFAIDTQNKSILLVPREQICVPSGVPNANEYAEDKNILVAMSYAEDGIRQIDPLLSPEFFTDPTDPSFQQLSIESVPKQNLFFVGVPAKKATSFTGGTCRTINNSAAAKPYWEISREIRVFRLASHDFSLGAREFQDWRDGKLMASNNAIPLSEYLGPTATPMIHARASFDKSPFFIEPSYPVDIPNNSSGPQAPLVERTVFTQVNAQVTGEGLLVDGKVPQRNRIFINDPNPANVSTIVDQRIYYPQEGTGTIYPLQAPSDSASAVRNNVENGWRALDGGAEFWIRFNDLSNLATPPPAQIVIYEHFQKVPVKLQAIGSDALGNPVIDISMNPFVGPGATTSEAKLQRILKQEEALLNYNAIPPVGAITTGSIEFFPPEMELWVYDKIYLSSITPVPGLPAGPSPVQYTADFVYERRLAGPAAPYPGLFALETNSSGCISPPCAPDFGNSAVFSNPNPYGVFGILATPLTAFLNTYIPANDLGFNYPFEPPTTPDLGDSTELQKYVMVKFKDTSGDRIERFAPIWSNSITVPVNRQAAVQTTVPNVPLRTDGWLRIAYASAEDFNPSSGPLNQALLMPSITSTSLLIWDETLGLMPPSSPNAMPLTNVGWTTFPGDRNGFLAFGGYDSARPSGYPNPRPVIGGGPLTPGLSYIVDDIVFYENSAPILAAASNAASVSMLRHGVGEGGWDATSGTPSNNFFPGGNVSLFSPFFPAEPFYDFNRDGIRNDGGLVGLPISFYDYNANTFWDFGEPSADTFDSALYPASILATPFGEPFEDVNNSSAYENTSGDFFIDLNFNGLLDGEPFNETLFANWAYDPPIPGVQPGEAFDDINNNGQFDGGEPYIESNGTGQYDPRFGEPFTDILGNTNQSYDPGESFIDENFNGIWDAGEFYVDWDRNGAPTLGELFRENNLAIGYESSSFFDNTGTFPVLYPFYSTTFWTDSANTNPDWNNDGYYQPSGFFQGKLKQAIPEGARIGSVTFTAWHNTLSANPFMVGKISIDLDLRARDGRFRGQFVGIDNWASSGQAQVDESGVGLPLFTDTELFYRVNFLMPNPNIGFGGGNHHPTSSPVLDDLTITVVLPTPQVIEEKETAPILGQANESGRILQ